MEDIVAQLKEKAKGPDNTPSAAPMTTPAKKDGLDTLAQVKVNIAMTMLQQALSNTEFGSKEYDEVLKHLKAMTKDFGSRNVEDLVPAEIMQLVGGMAQMGGGNEVQQQLMKQMQQPQGQQPPQGQPQPPGGTPQMPQPGAQ